MVLVTKFGSDEEARILEEFKSLVGDLKQEESTCLRFLRARNHDLVKAEEMLRKSMEWRASVNIDECNEWPIAKEVQKEFWYGYAGKDKHGQAVIYIPLGKWHIKEFIENGYAPEMDKNTLFQFEYIARLRRETGQDQIHAIVDLDGLSYSQWTHYATAQMVVQVFKDFEANYPEILHKATVINAPWIFSTIFPWLKPLLSGSTLSKISIYNSNRNKWMCALMEDIPQEVVPEVWTPELLCAGSSSHNKLGDNYSAVKRE